MAGAIEVVRWWRERIRWSSRSTSYIAPDRDPAPDQHYPPGRPTAYVPVRGHHFRTRSYRASLLIAALARRLRRSSVGVLQRRLDRVGQAFDVVPIGAGMKWP
jgi:hypothetical protein